MLVLDHSAARCTSLTLRSTTRKNLKKGAALLVRHGVNFSEQRVMRECLRIALKFWRGRHGIATRNKKYNKRLGPYEIVPFYTTENMRSVAHTRCHHSGISLSRLMDFAVAHYLPRVLEHWLEVEYRGRDRADARMWAAKYALRRNRGSFVISYEDRTEKNDGVVLDYTEKTEILPWPPPRTLAA